jgi:S-adenosylmethionine synthetase
VERIVQPMATPTAEEGAVEVVERKGLGHPDTLCDAVAEVASAALSRHYRERFGAVLHHNVDKVLLVGGASKPAFGGGRILEPMDIHIAGRAVRDVGSDRVPVEDLAIHAARSWLRGHMRDLDPERHVRLHSHVRPGSADLVTLFERGGARDVPLANDTSIGVGYAPLSPLEAAVLRVDAHLRSEAVRRDHPELGEDLKLMAVRHGTAVHFTVADAFVDRHVAHTDDYLERKAALRSLVTDQLAPSFDAVEVQVNAADDPDQGNLYLTVTGTSAEAGDDGEAGRGNRANGLITPMRSMTMESIAGKNPVSHVGKIYNVAAGRIARALCARIAEVRSASCLLVSRIGAPVTEPQLVDVRLRTAEGGPVTTLEGPVRAVLDVELERMLDVDADAILASLTGAS